MYFLPGRCNYRYTLHFYSITMVTTFCIDLHIKLVHIYLVYMEIFIFDIHGTDSLYLTTEGTSSRSGSSTYLWGPRCLTLLKWPIPLQPGVEHPPCSEASINSKGPIKKSQNKKRERKKGYKVNQRVMRVKCLGSEHGRKNPIFESAHENRKRSNPVKLKTS